MRYFAQLFCHRCCCRPKAGAREDLKLRQACVSGGSLASALNIPGREVRRLDQLNLERHSKSTPVAWSLRYHRSPSLRPMLQRERDKMYIHITYVRSKMGTTSDIM